MEKIILLQCACAVGDESKRIQNARFPRDNSLGILLRSILGYGLKPYLNKILFLLLLSL